MTKVRNFSAAFIINGWQTPARSKVLRASSSHLSCEVKVWLTDRRIFESNLNLQLPYMLEFNIQPQAGGWFIFPDNAGCEIYQPLDYPSKRIERQDICQIEVCGCEVSFSYEMHGIHVILESGMITEETAFAIVTSISDRLATITGQPTVVYES